MIAPIVIICFEQMQNGSVAERERGKREGERERDGREREREEWRQRD